MEDLQKALAAALEYIDAIPKDVKLPAMPGFDRDWADSLLVPTINIDLTFMQSIRDAVEESAWIPSEYYMNDVVNDICRFVKGEPKPELVYLREVIDSLDEVSHYAVEVSLFNGNPPFNAVLFTGFKHGGYRSLWVSGSEGTDVNRYANVKVKVLHKIEFNEKYPKWGQDCDHWMGARKYDKRGRVK